MFSLMLRSVFHFLKNTTKFPFLHCYITLRGASQGGREDSEVKASLLLVQSRTMLLNVEGREKTRRFAQQTT